jgi:hypothetical protein
MEQKKIPYDYVEVDNGEGGVDQYWVMAATTDTDGQVYALILPVAKDENGQFINPDDAEGTVSVIMVRVSKDASGEGETYEEIDPDVEVELAARIMDKLHDEKWIAYPEDAEAEAEFNKIADEAAAKGLSEADTKMRSAIDKVEALLNKKEK